MSRTMLYHVVFGLKLGVELVAQRAEFGFWQVLGIYAICVTLDFKTIVLCSLAIYRLPSKTAAERWQHLVLLTIMLCSTALNHLIKCLFTPFLRAALQMQSNFILANATSVFRKQPTASSSSSKHFDIFDVRFCDIYRELRTSSFMCLSISN